MKFNVQNLFGYVLLSICCISCSGVNLTEWQFPYYYPIQQGNYVTEGQLSSLHIGMPKEQVANILGTPVSQFMFNESQWQYTYQYYRHDSLKGSYIVNLNFDDMNNLSSIESVGEVFDR